MLSNVTVPIVGFVAPSGTGKTQLLKALISRLKSEGFRVAVVKHSHHDFEIDKPGKDSYELHKSGAAQTLIASKYRWAMISENKNPEHEITLNTLIKQLDQSIVDIILVEGYKFECFPKIEVYRVNITSSKSAQPPLFLSDPDIVAVATDKSFVPKNGIALLDINDIKQISQFIIQHFSLKMPQ